jgi:cellulose synthase/poly-beta-1,6-N-acetylglucosamine synthase-like glycosyltransferase
MEVAERSRESLSGAKRSDSVRLPGAFVETLLTVALWVAALLGAAATCYLWVLAVVGLWPARRPSSPQSVSAWPRFAVVVPAQNEERDLPALLDSLRRLDFPPDFYQVWVVADNCTDNTAYVAVESGVRCLRRDDPTRVGKGWALRFAFDEVCRTEADAVVVLDADALVRPDLLRAFASRLAAGQRALQAANRLLPGSSPRSLLLAAENLLEDRLFYQARSRLGLPVLLRGNGMCLATSLLREHPWNSFSVTEDAEYAVGLVLQGEFPDQVADAVVMTRAPEQRREMVVQRTRWGAGHLRAALRCAPRLLLSGLRRLDLRTCDFAFALFVTSKTGLAAWIGAILLLSGLVRPLVGNGPMLVSAAALLGLAAYGVLGLVLCRPKLGDLLRAVAALPEVLATRYVVHFRSLRLWSSLGWVRTPRSQCQGER